MSSQPMSLIRFLDKNAERFALLVFYSMLVITMALVVFGRNVLSQSPIWGLEVVQGMLIYLAWIGAAAAVKDRAHIRIDVIHKFLSNRPKAGLYIFADLIVLALAIASFYWSIHPVEVSWERGSLIESFSVFGVSKVWFFISVPIGFGLVILRTVQSLVENTICLINGTAVFEGGELFE